VHVSHLSLHDFRSYPEAEVALAPGVTAFVGRNGQGKTNLVEAVDYIARLSSHWLLSAIAGAYIEFVRNIPLLFFVLFWYFGVIAALPAPRQSIGLFGVAFLNNRGLTIPLPDGMDNLRIAGLTILACVLAYAAFHVWARKRQERTGLFTPPGITRAARAKSFVEVSGTSAYWHRLLRGSRKRIPILRAGATPPRGCSRPARRPSPAKRPWSRSVVPANRAGPLSRSNWNRHPAWMWDCVRKGRWWLH